MSEIWIPLSSGGGVDLDVITAGADDVLAPKVIVGSDGEPLIGTLALSGNANTVDVRKGKAFYSNNAKSKLTGAMAEKGAQTYTPGKTNQVIAANQFLTGAQTILGDADLIPDNIVYGKSIFNVQGKVRKFLIKAGETKRLSSMYTPSYSAGWPPGSMYVVEIPTGMTVKSLIWKTEWVIGTYDGTPQMMGRKSEDLYSAAGVSFIMKQDSNFYINSTKARLPVLGSSGTVWYCIVGY